MIWPSSFPGCFYILAFLALFLPARRYRQQMYPVIADPTCAFARTDRLRCLSQLRFARMTFHCSFFASPRLFRCYSNSVKCTTRFSTLIYRTDCLFHPTKAFFVSGTYDFVKNMSEVLEQFNRPASQYPTLFCPHDLAL